jgi:uncharacterized protein (TIGR02453 family)
MAFDGWPEEALDFFEDLEADNSRSYWTAHKAIYDELVLGPMTELTDELGAEFGPVKIFRPYRDVRFSADKSPYRTEIGAIVGSGYIRLSAAGLAAGNGMFHLAADQLSRYRHRVADDVSGGELNRIASAIIDQDISLIGHEMLKSAPRGYQADHPRIELLRHKGLVAFIEWPVEPWLGTAAVKDHLTEFLVTTEPLAGWLDTHVGPSLDAERGRR